MNKFWDRVDKCEHKNLKRTDACEWGYCWTGEICGTWDEYWCPDCRVYITECRCGSSNSMTGRHTK